MTTTLTPPAPEADPPAPGVRMVDLDQIDTHSGTESRPLHDPVVDEYAAAWKAGADFPPVDLFWDGSRFHVGDGSHRIAGARKAGRKQIPALVREGTRHDALLHSLAANQRHGLRRSPADKRYAVGKALAELTDFSDRQIARLIGVSHTFVAHCRREATGNVASCAQTRVGADGKRRKMPRQAPRASKSSPAPGPPASGLPARWLPPDWPPCDWSAVNTSASAMGFSAEDFQQVALPLQTLADGFLTVARCLFLGDPRMASVVPLVFNALQSELEKAKPIPMATAGPCGDRQADT